MTDEERKAVREMVRFFEKLAILRCEKKALEDVKRLLQ
jgi:hypothetical protein